MDPGDVSWTDKYQREESPRLKTVDSRKQFRSCLQDSDLSEIDGTLVCPEVYQWSSKLNLDFRAPLSANQESK